MSRALAFALGICLSGSAVARADGWVLPSGSEQRVLDFLKPLALGAPVGNYVLDGVELRSERIRLTFVDKSSGDSATMDLLHPGNSSDGIQAGQVRLAPTGHIPEDLLNAVKEALGSSRSTVPWVRAEISDSVAPSQPVEAVAPVRALTDFRAPLVPVALAILALLIIATAVLIWSARKEMPQWAMIALAAITLLGALLRTFVSPHTFLHFGYHIADYTEMYLFGGAGMQFYGPTGPAIYRLANAMFGGNERAIFNANAVLATLTIPALAALDFALFRIWPRALVSALLLAVWPMHLRASASEDLSNPEVLFAVWGLAAFVRFCSAPAILTMIVSTCAGILAIGSRPEAIVLPVLPVAYVAITRRWSVPRDWRFISFGLIFAGAWAYRLRELHSMIPGRSAFSWDSIALFDPTWTPRLFLLFFVVSVLIARKDGFIAPVIWLASCVSILTTAILLGGGNSDDSARTQMIVVPFFLAVCTHFIGGLLRTTLHTLFGIVILACILAIPIQKEIRAGTGDLGQEWQFLQDSADRLPDRGTLLTVAGTTTGNVNGEERVRTDAFPRIVLREHHRELAIRDIDTAEAAGDWPDGPGLVYYEGIYCFICVPPEQLNDGMHSRCKSVRERYDLKPIVTRTLPGPSYSPTGCGSPPYQVGFYEATRRTTER